MNTYNEKIAYNTVSKIFKKIRNVIYKYYYILYQSELLETSNEHKIFGVYESLFTHYRKGIQI